MRVFSLAEESAGQKGWPMGQDEGRLQIEVPTQDDRSQVVFIESGVDRDGDTIAWIWSKAADSDATDDPWALLALNSELSYGRIALRDDEIVVAHALYDAMADLDEVGKTIFWVAFAADELECNLYGRHVDVL